MFLHRVPFSSVILEAAQYTVFTHSTLQITNIAPGARDLSSRTMGLYQEPEGSEAIRGHGPHIRRDNA